MRQIAEGLKLGVLHPVAGDLDMIHETADARRREIEQGDRFSPAFKQQQLDAIDAETAVLVEKAKAEHRKASMRPLDTEEGRLRLTLREAANDPAAQFREARASRFASLMSNARDADTVDSVWQDVLLTNDSDAISAAASAGLKRHADLAAAAKHVPTQRDAATARLMAFESDVEKWSRSHPSPARRLAAIERERQHIDVAIAETSEFVARLHGTGSKGRISSSFNEAPGFNQRAQRRQDQRDTRLRVGPGFDLLAGMNRTGVRR